MSAKASDPELRIRARNEALISDAATRLFARKGFEGTRISEIAEAAGLPKANVYYYFGSKAEIYRSILRRLLTNWTVALDHLSEERDPFEALEAYVRAKLEHSRRFPDETRVFATEILAGGPYLTPEDRELMRVGMLRPVEVLEAWIARGLIRPVHPRHLMITLWSAAQYYADFEIMAAHTLEVKKLKRADYDTAADTIVQTTLRGLRPDPVPA
ncbi:TetR/AcrR family transcriptional regulator [Pseudooceanicola sp. CBS1P-1]|uniref:TetR family transcriptional regulator n=1 Tax=Pseudooceanicola albus TaxID=2692189 RepID=A0A6L7G2I2_9RHOB|nr:MULTISPECIES: TetR/AcrR family transcriptional regulator [Pseudooceanicola]MBT9384594.1 TetR/AcrR family transcriptional regulator [Pseudooceanicola endophyticus]MXN18295.1 TetR family transcriptional regulator [Pseudooceanicola albus]